MSRPLRKLAQVILPKSWQARQSQAKLDAEWLDRCEQNIQRLMQMLIEGKPSDGIEKYEMSFYSQQGEDGVLLYILSRIGATNRCFVEFGVGDGRECCTANLALNQGWHGLIMDGGERNIATAREYYKARLGEEAQRVKIVQAWITRDNINSLITDAGIGGEIDLLSVDIDGNDYWVWDAITAINPRVVVAEYNSSFGPERAVTINYQPDFDWKSAHPSRCYHGASLAALTKLANSKGYMLVGCESKGVNAFFVCRDVGEGKLSEVSVKEAFRPHYERLHLGTPDEQFELIKHMDLVDV